MSTINYAEFFEKMVRANFRNLHTLSKIPNLSHTAHSVVKQEILSRQRFFREINYLVTSLVNTLLSRNFSIKSVRENFSFFHIVRTVEK